ncbi:MAG TPA: MoxR family ATPase [Bacteroidetes bacterium]|nr:MoxR family ATPase [Bacteroidota bacterium]
MDGQNLHFENRIDLEKLQNAVLKIRQEIHKIIIGQDEFIDFLIIGLLSDGHVLIEGVPGIAKTLTARLLAKTIDTGFSRIQFTPDLMPSDIIGTSVLNMQTTKFEFRPGPVFSNIVLIDEINRAPAKTQSALFEVMEERQVTVDGNTYQMENPFMILSTQNPIEQEGTYKLPEAQLDRFLFKINVDYPDLEEEIEIIKTHHERKGKKALTIVDPILSQAEILEYKVKVHEIIVEEKIIKYIAEIINKTRNHPHLYLGASPRASIVVLNTSKANAAINGRDFVMPEDVKRVLKPVLRHRLIMTPEKEMEGFSTDKIIDMIIQSLEIPR